MQVVRLIITGDIESGKVEVSGPIKDMRLVYWLIGEGLRVCEREADKRDKEKESPIVIAKGLPT